MASKHFCLLLALVLACEPTTPHAPAVVASLPAPSAPAGSAAVATAPSSPPPSAPAPALRTADPAVPLAAAPAPSPQPPGAPASKPSDADRLIAAARSRLRFCYQRQLQNDPALEAKTGRWEMKLDAQGQVTKATYACPQKLPAELQQCLARVFESLSFGPGGGSSVTSGQCAAVAP